MLHSSFFFFFFFLTIFNPSFFLFQSRYGGRVASTLSEINLVRAGGGSRWERGSVGNLIAGINRLVSEVRNGTAEEMIASK